MTPAEFLASQGIRCTSRPGNHKTLCPRCSATRKNKRDRCLSVTIVGDGAVVHCHNCGWSMGNGTGALHASRHVFTDREMTKRRFIERMRVAAS